MSGRWFLDTNVIVYTFDGSEPEKRSRASDLVHRSLSSGDGIVSYQVVQEFLNVCTCKFTRPLSIPDAKAYIEEVLLPLCDVFPSSDMYIRALDVQQRTGFSFYDSLIVQAALEGECETLYSEDLQDGYKLHGLTIRNPFAG